MHESLSSITIDPSTIDTNLLYRNWGWLLPDGLRVFLLSMFGDWFLVDREGRVLMLDVLEGSLTQIADSEAEFLSALERAQVRDDWLLEGLCLALERDGVSLGPGRIFGYKIHPKLGAPIDRLNIEDADFAGYQAFVAELHRALDAAPPGSTITSIAVDGEVPLPASKPWWKFW